MKKKSAKISEFQGIKGLVLNAGVLMIVYKGREEDRIYMSLGRNIRAALYQIDDDVEEQKLLREQLTKLLENKRNEKLDKFLSKSPCFEAIKKADEDDRKR